MNRRVGATLATFAALFALGGATALGQDTQPAATNPAPPAASSDQPAPAASAASSAAPAASGAPAAAGSAGSAGSAKPVVTGYAYSEHPRAASMPSSGVHHARMARHAGEALATFTGFEMLADGGSRIFVQLSRPVEVEQTKDAPASTARKGKRAAKSPATQAGNRLVFTLKGAEIGRTNDENPLETMHFNTPVVSARLVPAGRDLRLLVVLRQDVTPTLKTVPAKDNASIVQIDFPAGSYLPPGDAAPASPGAGAKQPVQGALPTNDSASPSGQATGPTP